MNAAPIPAGETLARRLAIAAAAVAAALSLTGTADAFEDGATAVDQELTAHVPSGLTATSSGDGGVVLDWHDNATPSGRYQVYRDGRLIADGPVRSEYTDNGLENGRRYEYRVSAGRMPNVSDWSAPASATPSRLPGEVSNRPIGAVPHTSERPAVPAGLTAVASGDGSIALDWTDNPSRYGRYQVYRDGRLIADGPVHSEYLDEGLEPGCAYEYRVSAGTRPALSAWTPPVSAVTATTPDPTASRPSAPAHGGRPGVPTGLRLVSSAPGAVTLDWNDNAGVPTGYQVYRDDRLIADGVPESSYVDAGAVAGRRYSYRVSAGADPVYGDWTHPVGVSVPLTAPEPTPAPTCGKDSYEYEDDDDASEHGGGTVTPPAASVPPAAPTAPAAGGTGTGGTGDASNISTNALLARYGSGLLVGDVLAGTGYTFQSSGAGNSASDVPDPTGTGAKVIRLATDENSGTGSIVRSQLVAPRSFPSGSEYWQVSRVYLDPRYPDNFSWMTIMADAGAPHEGSSPAGIHVVNPSGNSGISGPRLAWSPNGNHVQQRDVRPWQVPLVRGKWIAIARHVKLSPDPGTGFYEIYYSPDATNQPMTLQKMNPTPGGTLVNNGTRMMFPTIDRSNDGAAGAATNYAAARVNPRINNYHGDNQPGWNGTYSNYFAKHRLWPANVKLADLNAVYTGR